MKGPRAFLYTGYAFLCFQPRSAPLGSPLGKMETEKVFFALIQTKNDLS